MDHQWLAQEFREAARAVVATTDDPEMSRLRVTSVEAGPMATIRFEGAPVLEAVTDDGIERVDLTPIVQAIAWTMERRARRFANRETYGEGDRDWVAALRSRFPGWFECEVSPNPGWADLVFAMAEQVEILAPGPHFGFTQVKEKFGTLRAYHAGFTDAVADLIDAFEVASGGVCERCGSPGILRRIKGYWCLTSCSEHAEGALPMSDQDNR